jgi:hypothetical protein
MIIAGLPMGNDVGALLPDKRSKAQLAMQEYASAAQNPKL